MRSSVHTQRDKVPLLASACCESGSEIRIRVMILLLLNHTISTVKLIGFT